MKRSEILLIAVVGVIVVHIGFLWFRSDARVDQVSELQQAYKKAWQTIPTAVAQVDSIDEVAHLLQSTGFLKKHFSTFGIAVVAGTHIHAGNAIFMRVGKESFALQNRNIRLLPPDNTVLVEGQEVRFIADPVPSSLLLAEFIVDGEVLSTSQRYPFGVIWSPQAQTAVTLAWVGHFLDGSQMTLRSTNITIHPNVPPVLEVVVSPLRGGKNVPRTISVIASDPNPDDKVAEVSVSYQLLGHNRQIGSSSSRPFEFVWTPPAEGEYKLQAVATDNHGMAGYSQLINISVH